MNVRRGKRIAATSDIGPYGYVASSGDGRPQGSPLRKRSKGCVGEGRCENPIGKHSVGADAYIGPPGLIQHLLLTVSLRSQCEHWLWQSVLLDLCAGGLRIPTTSLRTGLGMTRKFFRLLSLRGRYAPVAIRIPRPLGPLAYCGLSAILPLSKGHFSFSPPSYHISSQKTTLILSFA